MSSVTYAHERDRQLSMMLREKIKELPDFCTDFFMAIEQRTSVKTRLAYTVDLKTFFTYLRHEESDFFEDQSIRSLSLPDMNRVTPALLERYLGFLTIYQKCDAQERSKILENASPGKERKLSTIRALFKHLFKRECIESNVAALVDSPKKHEKPIVKLEPDEIVRILVAAETGAQFTPHQQRYHVRSRVRDVALLTLLLGTGIRVSECVGLNLGDLDMDGASMAVTRKGGDRVILYLSEEVMVALGAWLEERVHIVPLGGHEAALFLSLQRRRMTVLAVENLVGKYAAIATPLKRITPHKLRSTYGTQLYQATGDIYLVADVLGHSDVNTTRRHYAAMADDRRRQAATVLKLRDD